MRNFWLWVCILCIAIFYILGRSSKNTNKSIKKFQDKIDANNKKLKNVRSRKVNAKKFHDMSNKSLVAMRDRLRKKRRNKSK